MLWPGLFWLRIIRGGGDARPSNLGVEIANGAVTLSWDAPVSDADSVTGYEILRRRPRNGENALMVLVNDTGSNDTSYVDRTATKAGVRYTYRVKAIRDGVRSGRSNYARIDLTENLTPPEPDENVQSALLTDSKYFSINTVYGADSNVLREVFELDSSHTDPYGVWANFENFWVVQNTNVNKIFAYKRSDGSRDSSMDFNTLHAAGNQDPDGIWSDSETMFVVDQDDRKVYAYWMSNKSYNPSRSFSLQSGHTNASGIWGNGSVFWVLNDSSGVITDRILAYASNGDRINSLDLTVGSNDKGGIWSDGETMWVVYDGFNNEKLHAYSISGSSRVSGRDVNLDSANTHPTGIWSDGVTMYVVDRDDEKVYAYGMPLSSFVKNTGQTVSTTSNLILDGSRRAQRFTTGSDSSGYILNSVSINFGSLNSPARESMDVSVRESGAGSRPGDSVCVLIHPSSYVSTGVNTFRAPVNCTLDGNTQYFVNVRHPGGAFANSINLRSTESDDEDNGAAGGWSIANGHYASSTYVSSRALMIGVEGTTLIKSSWRPSAPVAPALIHLNYDSLSVTWSEPDNSGPPITDYDVEYREGSSGPFINWPHDGADRFTTITGLEEDAEYEVRVRAYNSEGFSEWSPVRLSSIILVSNINQPLGVDGHQIDNNIFVAQQFTTGNHSNGYSVFRVVVKINGASSTRVPVVSIYTSAADTRPGVKLYEFSGSVTEVGDRIFTLPAGATLSPDTSYFVHVAGGSGSGFFKARYGHGNANGFDSSSLPGWNISTLWFKSSNGGQSWSSSGGFHPRFSVLGVLRLRPVPDINNPPVFSGNSTFSVSENSVGVGVVVASDPDSQDDITGYLISGGADSSRFMIADNGVLSFKSVPNYENPGDSGRDNEYVVEVRVTSGSGVRESFSSKTFTVSVTDVVERPSAPAAPDLTSLNSTSLFVDWDKPGNTGPSITGYDVQYRPGSGGSFVNWYHNGTSRITTITGLSDSTLYYVWVRASSAEGVSDWSRTSYVITDSADAILPVNSSLLVSNINQPLGVDGHQIDNNIFVAQQFTTGNHSNGYSVFRVVVKINGASSTRVPVVSIYSSDGTRPGVKLYEFSGSVTETGDRNFTVSRGVTLSPDTSYFVHVAGGSGSGFFKARYGHGNANGFDSSSLPGWNISTLWFKSSNGGQSWSSSGGFHPRFSVLGAQRSGSVPDVNNPPEFSSGDSFSVSENSVSVGVVVASDPDGQDSVTGYGIWSGVDSSRFSITNAGVLTFDSVPNYESPVDNGGNNVYNLVVRATSGTGVRVRTATQDITVAVDDVGEAPLAPAVPVLVSSTNSSLSVVWEEPVNAGPAITDYDVRYYVQGNSGASLPWPHWSTDRNATITSLIADTVYGVIVRADNAEGTSNWSEPGFFRTVDSSPVVEPPEPVVEPPEPVVEPPEPVVVDESVPGNFSYFTVIRDRTDTGVLADVVLSWDPPVNSSGYWVYSYLIERLIRYSDNNGSVWNSSWNSVSDTPVYPLTNFTDVGRKTRLYENNRYVNGSRGVWFPSSGSSLGMEYFYRVRAARAADNMLSYSGPNVLMVSGPEMSAPGNLDFSVSESVVGNDTGYQVTLTWDAPSGGGDVGGYRVERRKIGPGEDGSFKVYADTGNTSRSFTDGEVLFVTYPYGNGTYEYVVRSVGVSGVSERSDVVRVNDNTI